MIQPQTEVRLLEHVPLTNGYEHQITFSSITEQTNYFLSKSMYIFTDFIYQREEQAVKIPLSYDSATRTNYIMYRNSEYSDKWFYGFITHKEYVNPHTTRFYFELDVFQTWQFDISWRQSYVAREHCPLWNGDGTPVVNTLDEGLNYGTAYETVSIKKYIPFDGLYFMVIITKSTMHSNLEDGVKPVLNGLPQPLTFYIHPFKIDGSTPNIMLDGEGAGLSTINEVFEALYKNENAVNNVVSIYVTEYCGIDMTYDSGFDEWNMSRNNVQMVAINGTPSFTTLNVWNMPTYTKKEVSFTNIYDDFETVAESKLFMHPYAVTILDDFKGNRIELKNEYLEQGILNLMVQGSLGTSNKVAYTVTNYLRDGDLDSSLLNVHGLEVSVINDNPNDLPVLSEYLSAFLQGNRNALENQANSVLFNGIANVLGSGVSGNIAGAITGGTNTFFTLQGMNAKIKDISNIPPTLSKLGGNTHFDYGNGISGVYIIKKQITQEYRDKLTDYFKMYGYKINQLKIPNLNTRPYYNYIQTVGANITGNVPNDYMEKIKAMFNNGVTLWHTPDVGNYDVVNN